MTQPYALYIADILEDSSKPADIAKKAAAELRRLHEAHDWQYWVAGELLRNVEKLEDQRDALLEALKMIAGQAPCIDNLMSDKDIARTALAKAEENT